jgi:hypothetical protein
MMDDEWLKPMTHGRVLKLGPLSAAEQSQTGPEVSVEDGRAAKTLAEAQVTSA